MAKEKLIRKMPFKGKIAFLIGASTGIGRATAKEFVQLGGSILIVARRQHVLEEALEEIKQNIVDDAQFVEIFSCDATDMDKLKPLMEDVIKKHGTPDYLFNIVGFAIPGYIENYVLDDFKKNMNRNYYGQLVPTLILLPYFMKEKKRTYNLFLIDLRIYGNDGIWSLCPYQVCYCWISRSFT